MQFHKENAPVAGMGREAGGNGALAMGSLLANMNHDIRTSMNGVRGMLDLLLDTGLTPSQQQYARTAQHSMDHLLESLERIVDMSLIESNEFRLNPVPFDLLQEMKAALASKPASARSKGIGLTIDYPPSMILHGDAARLREAASGLVDLALQCSAGGSVTIAVQVASPSAGQCNIDLAVQVSKLSDDGERLSSLLDASLANDLAPFQSCDRDSLGPALCGHLVRLMGGTIHIERGSAAGSIGSVFRLSIPLPLAATPLAGVRGLLIAENAAEWQPSIQALARHGIKVDVFDSAMPALAAVTAAASEHAPYQVIMLGRHVQGMDAAVLAGAIKANPAYRETRFALLDDVPGADMDILAREGFVAHLCKSANHTSIESTLLRLWTAAANGSSMPFLSTDNAATPKTDDDSALAFPGRKILVADDNQVNQQVAARMLEKLGCQCELADDGSQAVDMHTTGTFDLILMDCEMPVLDGLQATMRIREGERSGRRTPIIALTACTGQGEQEQCIAAGMDGFLSKPIRPQMLRDMLSRWLPESASSADEVPVAEYSDELEAVKEMFGADFAELAALYQNDGPPRLAAIREAFSGSDCARVAKVAHAFAGSSASIGATGLSAICKEVEISAKTGSLDAFEKRMAAIDTEYARICNKLQSLLKP
jgi:CheY-like chemotaxis protein/HPt (histidine-containing phosphotransfer) domain-containing protein